MPSGGPTQAPSAAPASPPAAGIPADCPTSPPPPLAADDTATVTLATEKGDIVIEVKGSLAPNAAGNFVALAECGFFDGVIFHRLVPGFVIQGGDGEFGRTPNVDMSGSGRAAPATRSPTTPCHDALRARHGRHGQLRRRHERQPVLHLPGRRRPGPPDYSIFGAVTVGDGRRRRDRRHAELGRPGEPGAGAGRHHEGHGEPPLTIRASARRRTTTHHPRRNP